MTVANLADRVDRPGNAQAIGDPLCKRQRPVEFSRKIARGERFRVGQAGRKQVPEIVRRIDSLRLQDVIESTIDDAISWPSPARDPDLLDRHPQQVEAEVLIGKERGDADQVVENVHQRAALRALAARPLRAVRGRGG